MQTALYSLEYRQSTVGDFLPVNSLSDTSIDEMEIGGYGFSVLTGMRV